MLSDPEASKGDPEESAAKWVYVSLSTCGHAQSVYGDSDQEDLIDNLLGDLHVGLSVKRITVDDWRVNYSRSFLCGCPTVGHERDSELSALTASTGPSTQKVAPLKGDR